ncbi:MAG: choice-of-anchor I family protein [Acidimicrobiales bacterium]
MFANSHRRVRAAAAVLSAAALAALALTGAAAGAPGDRARSRVSLAPIGTYESGVFDESAAEIVAHDPASQRLFVVNAEAGVLDVLDIADPTAPTLISVIEAQGDGKINSVAAGDGVIAAAVEAEVSQDPGAVELYDADGRLLAAVEVGALPDMLTFTPDGTKLVVANEGEPDGYCVGGVDPEGSVSIIDLAGGIDNPTVRTADFTAYNDRADELRAAGVRIFGPGASVAQDLEPEYVAIDAGSTTAWVALQENNAFAIVDLASATVTDIVPLGFKDHSAEGNGLDASNTDGEINIDTWPVQGMYMPDGIDAYEHGNRTYIVTANEGDARDYDCYSEEARVKDLDLSGWPEADELQDDANLGRLKTTTAFPTPEPVTELYSYGARSFSIRDEAGNLVFDSGDDFERITAAALPEEFNSNNDENDSFDTRSDDKGPEPEGIEIGRAYGKTYAFIGLERVGGIMVYDITTPRHPRFVQYVNNRDFTGDAEAGIAGDLGPEGLAFITAADSPNGKPLLAVGNEVSGTTTIYELSGPGRPR